MIRNRTTKNFLKAHIFACSIVIALSLCFATSQKANAEPFDEQSFEFLIRGDVETLIKNIEKEKDFDWQKGKIDLGRRNSEYYAISLMVVGDFERAEKFLERARERYPKSSELEKNLLKD